jgi:hypothetical protein
MAPVLWDRKGVLLVEFMQQGTTITSEMYCELHRAIQNKSHVILTSSIMLLHGNALPHTATLIQAWLEHFNWEWFDYSPYSPVLAPK